MIEDRLDDIPRIYLDGVQLTRYDLEVKPVMKYSNGMPITQNIYYLDCQEVMLVDKWQEYDGIWCLEFGSIEKG